MAARLDGNALAGSLAEVLGRDMTTVAGRCGHCGDSAELARTMVYADAPGIVVRCAACSDVLFTIVHTDGRTAITFHCIAALQLDD